MLNYKIILYSLGWYNMSSIGKGELGGRLVGGMKIWNARERKAT